jgi:Leucine-rich repeat (LRR) protein
VGVIPSEIGRCLNLTKVLIGNNALTGDVGPIINMLPRNLTMMDLDDNLLNGTVPSSIGTFTNLELLHLGDNNLNGTIPTELGLLSNLEALGLNSNQLTGMVPTSLAGLPHLGKSQSRSSTLLPLLFLRVHILLTTERLYLYDNNLTGSLDAFCGIDFEEFAANTCVQVEIVCACCNFTHCCDTALNCTAL